MDLDGAARDLKHLEARLERRVAPLRARYDALGVGGLYALAAAEQDLADASTDDAARRVHTTAARAAEALADAAAYDAARAH